MNNQVMYQFTYGLFVLMAREGEKENGCIINTAMQVTSSPNRVMIAVNKQNYTHDMIERTREFNVCILNEQAPFAVFKRFGFQSGRDGNKLEGCKVKHSENNIAYIEEYSCAYLSGKVIQTVDVNTHTVFIAEVTAAELVAGGTPVTYGYYQDHIKPKPEKTEKVGYRCKICGYIYEGEPLPEDFVCPICKHGAEDFRRI